MTYEDFKKKQQARARPRVERSGAVQRALLLERPFHACPRADAAPEPLQAEAKVAMEQAAQEDAATRAFALA